MRKLASIRKIDEIRPIEGADAIECAVVGGWTVVVKKGEMKPGDLAVYFEIDSFLPIRPEFEFLRKSCYKNVNGLGEGFRLRTIRLRGQLSQGLVLPLTNALFPTSRLVDLYEGEDVTAELGVIKYEPPVPAQLSGRARGNFPLFIRKTDQERCQNLKREIFMDNIDSEYEVTLKLDGSSITIYHNEGVVGVCSRNLDLQLDQEGNAFVDMAKKSGLLGLIPGMGNVAIQGELMGPGIQGNREGFPDTRMFIFDIFDIDTENYVSPEWRHTLLSGLLPEVRDVYMAPVIRTGRIECEDVFGLLEQADGKSINNPVREGLVFKRMDGRFSFKAISNKFLLQEKA